jgi:hypothetical protein
MLALKISRLSAATARAVRRHWRFQHQWENRYNITHCMGTLSQALMRDFKVSPLARCAGDWFRYRRRSSCKQCRSVISGSAFS